MRASELPRRWRRASNGAARLRSHCAGARRRVSPPPSSTPPSGSPRPCRRWTWGRTSWRRCHPPPASSWRSPPWTSLGTSSSACRRRSGAWRFWRRSTARRTGCGRTAWRWTRSRRSRRCSCWTCATTTRSATSRRRAASSASLRYWPIGCPACAASPRRGHRSTRSSTPPAATRRTSPRSSRRSARAPCGGGSRSSSATPRTRPGWSGRRSCAGSWRTTPPTAPARCGAWRGRRSRRPRAPSSRRSWRSGRRRRSASARPSGRRRT